MKKVLFVFAILYCSVSVIKAQQSEVFVKDGKAIRGYDPVAFFTLNRPEKGYDSLQYHWKNAVWLFSSRGNLEKFTADPEKFCPQYGGYCAYGTADGHKAPTETDTWTIVNGKLYFNYNQKVKSFWTKNQEALILKADANWVGIKNKE